MASIWARYSPMIRIRAPGWPSRSSPRRIIFAGFSAAMRNCDRLPASAYSIRRSGLIGTRSTQVAPAPGLPFQVFPGDIETLRPDESEDVRLAFIFSREGRGETETAARLKIGCRAEDRSG